MQAPEIIAIVCLILLLLIVLNAYLGRRAQVKWYEARRLPLTSRPPKPNRFVHLLDWMLTFRTPKY